jgi:hypothetical protein
MARPLRRISPWAEPKLFHFFSMNRLASQPYLQFFRIVRMPKEAKLAFIDLFSRVFPANPLFFFPSG